MRKGLIISLCISTLLFSCKNEASQGTAEQQSSQAKQQSSQAKKSTLAELPKRPAKTSNSLIGPIPWIENDYKTALQKAKLLKKPLVIDMWADWCHTCLAMKKGVLQDPGLGAESDQYVWLAVDTENPASALAMKTFPTKALPTFYVVSPVDESVQATQIGSCTADEFRDFLKRGASGTLASLDAKGALEKGSTGYHLRLADRAALKGEHQKAADVYGKALANSPEQWSLQASTLKSQIIELGELEDKSQCIKLANDSLDIMVGLKSSASTDFMYYAFDCSDKSDKSATGLQSRALDALDKILANPDALLSEDDRSDALASSRSLAQSLEQQDRALAYAKAQQKLLAEAVKESGSPLEEMTYVWHQVEVHAFLKEGDKILPWVASLEKRLPKEYDPPYRKAWLLHKMGRNEDALRALDAAFPLVQGARRGRFFALQASIHKTNNNKKAERISRQAVIDHYESLPKGLRSQAKIDAAKKELAAILPL